MAETKLFLFLFGPGSEGNDDSYKVVRLHVHAGNTVEPLYNGHHWDPIFCLL